MSIYSNPHDTPQIMAQILEHDELDDAIQGLYERQRVLAGRIDRARMALRPELLSDARKERIDVALQRISEGDVPQSHHGELLGEGVSVHGARGFVHISLRSPYHVSGYDRGVLWRFTEEDVVAVAAYIEAQGFIVGDRWTGADWVSFSGIRVAS